MRPLRVRPRPGGGVRNLIGKPSVGGSTWAGGDYGGDPILQQIRALALQNVAGAEASAAGSRRETLTNFGYVPGLDYGGADIQQAAAQNPYSVLAQLARAHDQRTLALNENLNRNNLFYSSTRGQELGREATGYVGQQAEAQSKVQAILNQIASTLAGAKQTEQGRLIQAEQDAQQRALQNALKYGYGQGVPVRPPKKPKPKPKGR